MKKIIVVLSLAILISGCAILNPPDVDAIEDLLTEEMTVTVEPKDGGADIVISNMPEELPHGLECINVYVDNNDLEGKSVDELGEPVAEDITGDITIEVTGQENGVETFVGGVGSMIGGQTTDAYGFGGGFYPRPGGTGTFLGGPNNDGSESQGIIFDRESGEYTVGDVTAETDFFFYQEGTEIYVVAVHNDAGVALHDNSEDEWLDVKTKADNYDSAVPVTEGDICHFVTHDDYYGKFEVTKAMINTILMEGEISIDIKYAFQTNQHVGHY